MNGKERNDCVKRRLRNLSRRCSPCFPRWLSVAAAHGYAVGVIAAQAARSRDEDDVWVPLERRHSARTSAQAGGGCAVYVPVQAAGDDIRAVHG